MAAVRADLDPDDARLRRLTAPAARAARLKQAPVPVADVDDAEPPDPALVRLAVVGPPILRAPALVDDEKPAVRGAEEVEEAEVRQAVEITVAGESTDSRGDRRIAFADVELAGRRYYGTAKRQIGAALHPLGGNGAP